MLKNEAPRVKYLSEYKEPTHRIEKIDLTFTLDPERTHVRSVMKVIPSAGHTELYLNGEELELKSVSVNDVDITNTDGRVESVENAIILKDLPEQEFELTIENYNNPKANTALDGLYYSSDIFCTQNEPEGFRRITYYIDRPDNLAIFTTKIIAPKKDFPILLSNGNLIESGELDGGLHFAVWNDPFYKPAYLYALVAGDLALVKDVYKTASGRDVALEIYVDKGNEGKCHHAMESLKNSMRWDEQRFGLEYDLDIYMIVAVDSFNMGAMENKGLNIFNSAYVLADQESATDKDYFGIESVIGHEYFHNWTGNRVTCRDWFQLTLKEGLTVFRDQEFSADLNSRPVCRIKDVKRLRGHQFIEDAGPTAHPIKPKSYIEMNNFYTSTVYEKGAEVIRMIHTMLGEDGFQAGMKKYFERFDGQAVTTEDFISSMSLANNDYDFSQFMLWYDQAGTPIVEVKVSTQNNEITLEFKQSTPATPEQPTKKPFHIPIKLGLVGTSGADQPLQLKNREDQQDLDRGILHLRNEVESFTFTGLVERVIPSLNRGFSAPIKLRTNLGNEDYSFLMGHDSDEFNRYEACQVYSMEVLKKILSGNKEIPSAYFDSYEKILTDNSIDDHFKALCLELPECEEIAMTKDIYEYDKARDALSFLEVELAKKFNDTFIKVYNDKSTSGEFCVSASEMGRRVLRNVALYFLALNKSNESLVKDHYVNADNMTDLYNSLSVMINNDHSYMSEAIDDFYKRFKSQTLVMQKWLSVQSGSSHPNCFERLKELENSDVYHSEVPNLVRALVGAFARNVVELTHPSGRGFEYVASKVIELDKINPQTASRIVSVFPDLKHLPQNLKDIATRELNKIIAIDEISKNVYEIVSKKLA